MSENQSKFNSQTDVITGPIKRMGKGAGIKGDTSLRSVIGWFDHQVIVIHEKFDALTAVVKAGATNKALKRGGRGGELNGDTSVDTVAAWSDHHLIVNNEAHEETQRLLKELIAKVDAK